MRLIRIPILAAAAALVFGACERDHEWVDDGVYTLVWQDEFEGPAGTLPDAEKWVADIGTNWGNNQLEYDTNHPENASLDGQGNLLIVARQESWQGSAYTSARLCTRGLYQPSRGRVEARMKLPSGQGLWPAFWLLGANISTTGWPACGEIDIMEYRGQEPGVIHNSLHGPGYSGGNAVTRRVDHSPTRYDQDFHVFAVEWEESLIRWQIDGLTTFEAAPDDLPGDWVYNHAFYLILNVAVGGNFVGAPNGSTVFPQTMSVDWVRVYQ